MLDLYLVIVIIRDALSVIMFHTPLHSHWGDINLLLTRYQLITLALGRKET